MTSWFVKAFEDALRSSLDCCGTNRRGGTQDPIQAPAPLKAVHPPQLSSRTKHRNTLPNHVVSKLRQLLVHNDYLAREIQERTSKSTMTSFLRQCIKGNEEACAQIWGLLRERQRKDLLDTCMYPHRASVFFTKIAEPDDHELPEPASEDWASASTTSDISSSWSKLGRESSTESRRS